MAKEVDNNQIKIVGKCPWCNENIKEISTEKGKMWVHETKTDKCDFVLFENTKIMGNKVKLTSEQVTSFLNGDILLFNLKSKKGNDYEANIKLDKIPNIYNDKKYPSFSIDSFKKDFNKDKDNSENNDSQDPNSDNKNNESPTIEFDAFPDIE